MSIKKKKKDIDHSNLIHDYHNKPNRHKLEIVIHPQTRKRMNRLWHTHTVEYYSAVNKNELAILKP